MKPHELASHKFFRRNPRKKNHPPHHRMNKKLRRRVRERDKAEAVR